MHIESMRSGSLSVSALERLFGSIAAAAIVAGQVVCLGQPDPSWKIHDNGRPKPPVVKPGTPSTQERPGEAPSDAAVLFGGTDLSPWVSLDGSPAKWIVREGHMECVKGSGYGRFGGKAGIAEFTELRWITVQTTPRHYPF